MTELLPWQQPQWEQVQRRRAAGRLPHALLCCGRPGLGKRQFAERLAQSLLCLHPATDGAPCGSCHSCRLFLAGSHPDLRRVEPLETGKVIKVEQIRELTAFLNHTSHQGGYQVAVVAPAERMNANAANSLLKTLEEPPADRLLLLVTAVPSQLPATVRSRCQQLLFTDPAPELARQWLEPRLPAGTDPALLLSLGAGAPLRALAAAADGRPARRQALFKLYADVLNGRQDPVRAAEDWRQGDITENVGWLVGWHTDMIRLKMLARPPRLFNPDLRADLQHLAARRTPQTLFRQLDAAVRLHTLCTTSVNLPALLEGLLAENAAG